MSTLLEAEANTFLDPSDATDFIANVLEASTEYPRRRKRGAQ